MILANLNIHIVTVVLLLLTFCLLLHPLWESVIVLCFVVCYFQCYSVLSDILVKIELCIPLERGSNVLSTGQGFIFLCPPSKLKISVLFCSIYKKKTISFSAIAF